MATISKLLQITGLFCKRALYKRLYSAEDTYNLRPVIFMNNSDSFAGDAMGWLRLVSSLKLQVSFPKEPFTGDDILQKRPMILRSLLIVATP